MLTLVLKPVSHPDLGPIHIDDALFAIGRREEPFVSDSGGSASKLSRRHARIFVENDVAYIADLGSLNGTVLNGRPVGREAVVLKSGDELGLGGEFQFRVDIAESAPAEAAEPAIATRLLLTPVDPEAGLETIVIERFPFLVNRNDELFAQYLSRFPEDVRRISRRQAVILEKGQDLCVEDLDSANGTFVGGERLDEHARPLASGDVIAFGGERFAYRTSIERFDSTAGQDATVFVAAEATDPGAAAVADPATAAGSADEAQPEAADHTRFVDSATSFLDVFCADDEPADADGRAPAQREPAGSARGAIGRTAAALEISGPSRRTVVVSVGLVLLVAAVIAGLYLSGMDRRAIKQALEAGEVRRSAEAAQVYLTAHPDDQQVSRWAEEAVMRTVLPGWMEAMEAGRFDAAAETVASARRDFDAIPDAGESLALLDWATRMQVYLDQRGGADAPMSIYGGERTIGALVEEWDAERFRNQQLLTQAGIWVPPFEPVASALISDLRALRRDHATYGADIAALKQDVTAALQNGEFEQLDGTLETFAAEHPNLQGIEVLAADVARYQALRAMADSDPLELADAVAQQQFETDLVADIASGWMATAAPSETALAAYRQARASWQEADLEGALAALEPLTDGPDAAAARRKMAHYRQIDQSFRALTDGGAASRQQLLAFRASLKLPEDVYFRTATEDQFQRYRSELQDEVVAHQASAAAAWDQFRRNGGLPSVVRVEEQVSDRYVQQAGLLAEAHQALTAGAAGYRMLGTEPPADWLTLRVRVLNEITRQRRALGDLAIVLEPDLLESKLRLLPEVSGSTLVESPETSL